MGVYMLRADSDDPILWSNILSVLTGFCTSSFLENKNRHVYNLPSKSPIHWSTTPNMIKNTFGKLTLTPGVPTKRASLTVSQIFRKPTNKNQHHLGAKIKALYFPKAHEAPQTLRTLRTPGPPQGQWLFHVFQGDPGEVLGGWTTRFGWWPKIRRNMEWLVVSTTQK